MIQLKHSKKFLLVLFAVLVATPVTGSAQGPDQAPPFRQGEVAVYASPAELPGYNVIKFLPLSGISVVQVTSGREFGHVQRFRNQGLRASLNLEAQAFAAGPDPYYSYQWNFPAVQAEAAWDTSTGTTAIVAVVDTGLAEGGTDGIGCVVSGYDIVNDDNDPADGDGHGTHVSGTVAQATNNSIGVAGLAYGACVMPVKVLDDSGSGSFADIAEGIRWAVDHGAHVINMSLGVNARFGITNDALVDPALDYAHSRGVTVVCASGNDGNRRNVSYPAIYPTTIAVGATDYNNNVTRYSNQGKGLDLVAPGGDTSVDANGDGYVDGILQETRYNGNWGYYFFQGTSMASPHVAAAAAMLYASGSAVTPDEIYAALTGSALDIGDPGVDKVSAHGLLQIADALSFDPGVEPPPPPPPPTCIDADNDGYCADVDCNDNDASINPGANDTKGRPGRDGVDNNCNGIIDG